MIYNSWTHRLARRLVRPLVGTWITPNHLTTLRLVTALGACAAFTVGAYAWDVWGGLLWTLSAFLDRADGELARLGGQTSRFGHRFDFATDVLASALFFVAIGIGLRESWLGDAALALGLLGGSGVAAASLFSELLERREATGRRAYEGAGGFDVDDVMYLFGPIAWLGGLAPLLVGASLGGPAFALLTWWRLRRARAGEAMRS